VAQIFHRSTNTIARVTIFGALFFIAATLWLLAMLVRSSYATRKDVFIAQPVPFSHDHHVAQIGIDCRYCHTAVEKSASAGIPPTATCMNCHSQIWSDSPMLEPVRASYKNGTSLEWNRVHDLADFVYFNHSVHVAKGIGCTSCHGKVDRMPLMSRAHTLQMEWCLECHRHPEKHLRPQSAIFDPNWQRPRDDGTLAQQLAATYDVQKLTNCVVCHR
jgi:hypothetical protein